MKILSAKNYDHMSRKAANIISAQIILNPRSVLGLATGSTPIGIYNQLIDWYKKGDLDFSECHAVNLDEYVGLPSTSDQSYAYFMYENLFKSVNIKMENTNIPDGMNKDVDAECERYNNVIKALGGVDIQLLGIGHNGHIGFNEPDEVFEKETHCVTLTQDTIDANARFFDNVDDIPRKAYTMGIKSIMNAKKVLLVASGSAKAEILYKTVAGSINPSVPASVLQLHNDVTIVADEDALAIIKEKVPHLISNV